MQKPFRISAFLGLGIVVISLVMMISGPSRTGPLADGYFTPIIAFEFATSIEELMGIFADGDGTLIEDTLLSLTNNTFLDFLFLVV